MANKIKSPTPRKVYILPNLFTAGSLFCGLLALFEIFDQGDYVQAIQFVIIAGILDVFDGLIARLTRTQSSFGVNFDSLADLVSFGVAPAALVYTSIAPEFPMIAKATCGLFVVCGALRLARFNVQSAKEEKRSFTGLPIPGAAAGAITLFWVLSEHPSIHGIFPPEKLLAPAMVLIAALMVSELPYYGVKSLRIDGRHSFELLVCVVIVLAMLVALKQHIDVVLFAMTAPYVLSGPVIYLAQQIRASQTARTETAGAPKPTSRPAEPGDPSSR